MLKFLFLLIIPLKGNSQNVESVFSSLHAIHFCEPLIKTDKNLSLDSVYKTIDDSIIFKNYIYDQKVEKKSIYGIPINRIIIKTDPNDIVIDIELEFLFDSSFKNKIINDIGVPHITLNFYEDDMENIYVWFLKYCKVIIFYERYGINFGQTLSDYIIVTFSKLK